MPDDTRSVIGQDEPIDYATEVYQALGTASMCWSETPTGVFDSELAAEIGDRLVALHEAELKKARGDAASYTAGWTDRGLWLNGALDTSARRPAPEAPAGYGHIVECDCQNRTFWYARREGYGTFICTNCGVNFVDDGEGFGQP